MVQYMPVDFKNFYMNHANLNNLIIGLAWVIYKDYSSNYVYIYLHVYLLYISVLKFAFGQKKNPVAVLN